MIERFANMLANQMEKERFLKHEMKDHYIYAIITMCERWITMTTILCLSVFLNQCIPTILFLIFFLSLRKRTGGYHANSFIECYFESIATYILVIVLSTILVNYMNLVYLFLAFSVILIVIIGTINHPNVAMNDLELQESKRAARYMISLESMVIIAGIVLDIEDIYVCYMSIAIILCAIFICIAKLLKQEVKRNERK